MSVETETLLTWTDVLADPARRALPGKVELSEEGKIIVGPSKVSHSHEVSLAMDSLRRLHPDSGHVYGSVAVQCRGSVRVMETDAAWVSDEWVQRNKDLPAADTAPEICVEVMSRGNTRTEMREKSERYLELGAREVWIVAIDGSKTVHKLP